MNFKKISGHCIVLFVLLFQHGYAQQTSDFTSIPLNTLDAFRNPGKNWTIASDAVVDYTKPHDMKAVQGQGTVVNIPDNNGRTHLFTKDEFGDLEVELDFMMAKNSNSGVYFQGRYEIQLLDSWARLQASSSDAGGIYLRWQKQRGIFEGNPPLMNVAKAPGLWQHLHVKFHAPRFNEKGEKTANAYFEQVFLNGVLVQQQSQVTGTTGSSMFQDEKPAGPLVFQGDHGQVAFKNIRVRALKPVEVVLNRPQNYTETISPILIHPDLYPYVLRSFMFYGDKKLNYAVSVGSASQIHYSYDLKSGAVFQIWRGDFIDATPMWNQRGYEQVAQPLGSVISLSDAPVFAILTDEKAEWPDSIAAEDLHPHGYSLDKKDRTPIFRYAIQGTEIRDSVSTGKNREGIVRTLTATLPSPNLYCRVAAGKSVEQLNDSLYAVSGKSYYIQIDKPYKPVIRQGATGQEIIVKYDPAMPLTYSIIW
jgi:hypothetical protein